ncbi:MAG TPA: hypothetical protein DD670_05785 [Planctomycetaceae bacterium]|nr:hypothetical protein [Planctomycetaceae bacterium]
MFKVMLTDRPAGSWKIALRADCEKDGFLFLVGLAELDRPYGTAFILVGMVWLAARRTPISMNLKTRFRVA